MKLAIKSGQIAGKIEAIASKSYAHRYLIAAALGKNLSNVICTERNEDIDATVRCLCSLGAEIVCDDGVFRIGRTISQQSVNQGVVLDCGESGSTLRFLLPVVAALGVEATFVGHGRLAERPLEDLLTVLTDNGVVVDGNKLPLTISGRLQGDTFCVGGGVSSQYISGMLLAMPIIGGNCKLIVGGSMQSFNYVDITLSVMSSQGVNIEKMNNTYLLKDGFYNGQGGKVEGDWSNAAFWLVGGAINGDITVSNLNFNSLQGDMRIVDIIRQAGANVTVNDDGIRVRSKRLQSINIDMSNIPDLAPIVAVLLANAEGTSVMSGVERLRIKESDRLQGIIDNLSSVGVQCRYENNALYIVGSQINYSDELQGFNDHRMVMMSVIMATVGKGGQVTDSNAVNKSYPKFFEHLKNLLLTDAN